MKMKIIILFFIIYLSSCELITNATVEIYHDSQGGAYLNYEKGYVNKILNHQNFELSAGYGKATFEINNHDITLLHYFALPPKKEEASSDSYSPMFGKTIYIGIFRGANRQDTSKCAPEAKVREYIRYIDLGMRIWGANQFKISQGNDLYITSKCLVIDEKIYQGAKYESVNNALYDAAKKIDNVPNVAVRFFINDNYNGDWMGLAAVGSPAMVANKESNLWLICKYNPNPDDPNNEKLKTIMHEFGHSCGFGHGGSLVAQVSGVFTSFVAYNNYNDCANIMGNCGGWDTTIIASQYRKVIVKSKPEPWQFIYPEEGLHKYRLYAFDHPYSRYFLGTNKPFHNETEMIDGIPFKYNCIAIRVLVNKTLTSKYTGIDGTSGSIMFEYKWNPKGQEGAQDFGVRVTYGFDNKGNLLMANMDHMKVWADSEIISNVDYYPSDFDTGTFRMRVLKIHKTKLKESLDKEIVKEDKRRYDEPGYAELEIEFFPNKKPKPESPPKELPNFIFSPSFYNCKKNDDESGYTCYRSTTSSGWYYFVNNGNKNRNTPRFYTHIDKFLKERLAHRSYNNYDFTRTKVCYGDEGIRCISMTTVIEYFRGVTIKTFQNAKVTRIKTNGGNSTVEDLGNKNVAFGTGLEVPEGGRAYITDLFGNERDIKVIDKTFVELLPTLETDGFAEGGVVVKDKNGKVIFYNIFTFYNQYNGNRVAVKENENGDGFELSPAAMPSSKYFSTHSLLFSITLKADNWFIYPILDLGYDDFVYFDFRGSIPDDLVMIIETDMGEYSRDLSFLGGLNSVSFKLTYVEVHRATGGWVEIDRIKFNKDVEIQNIRPVYSSRNGDQIVAVKAASDNINFDGYRYTVDAAETDKTYVYKKVDVDFDGESYSFDTSTSTQSIKSIDDIKSDGNNMWLIILIIVAVVIVLIAIIIIICKLKSKNRGSSRGTSANTYASKGAAAGAGMGGTYPPRGPAVGGYAGGYGK